MKVITNAFWLSFSRIAADILSFVLFAVISRTFGPAGSGQYSYAFAIATLVALACTAGFEDWGIRQYAGAEPHERAGLWRGLLTTQAVQLLIGISALGVFLLWNKMPAGGWIVVLELSIYVVGWTASYTFFIPALASQSMVSPAITDLACRLSAILIALVLGLFTHTSLVWMLAGFPLAGVVLACLALRSATRHGAALRLGAWQGVMATWRQTSAFAGSEVMNQFYARADILLIAYFLGDAKVGLYATDIKFVEVGILPLVLLGTAAYPLLSARGPDHRGPLSEAGRDFMRIVFFCSGWLAVGIYTLIPLLIVPIFGPKFAPSAALLPWFALFALLKGWEVAFYRLLYAVHRQSFYFGSLVVGTVLIVILNWELIPTQGIQGAIVAAIICIAVVDFICACGLLRHLRAQFLISVSARLAVATGLTAVTLVLAERMMGAGPWSGAIIACVLYPVLAMLCGLVPHPKRSPLLRHTGVENS